VKKPAEISLKHTRLACEPWVSKSKQEVAAISSLSLPFYLFIQSINHELFAEVTGAAAPRQNPATGTAPAELQRWKVENI
jgi:hypothetical protein